MQFGEVYPNGNKAERERGYIRRFRTRLRLCAEFHVETQTLVKYLYWSLCAL